MTRNLARWYSFFYFKSRDIVEDRIPKDELRLLDIMYVKDVRKNGK